jgi:hypothetical protein
MQSSVWALLIRQVPPEQHNNLMLVTRGGTEIAVQSVLRIDHEFMAIKGRLAGSQDAGRLFFVPFDQIDYLGFQQAVKESEFHDMFDGLSVPSPAAVAAPAAPVAAEPPPAVPAREPEAAPPVAPSLSGVSRPPTPIKSAVLERFRARSVSSPGTALRPPLGE